MSTFYHGASMIVTNRMLHVRTEPRRTIAIEKLEQIYAVTGSAHDLRGLFLASMWPAGVATGVTSVAAALDDISDAQWPLVIAVACLVVGSVAVFIARDRNSAVNELWVVVAGRHLCVLRTRNKEIFGQASRALVRARERRAQKAKRGR